VTSQLAKDHRLRSSANLAKEIRPGEIVVGKDILELLSSSMYVDPITIFREYIQNSADSIDQAREHGFLSPDERGHVDISLDAIGRTIKI
jgi:molecular chaperone HtpG